MDGQFNEINNWAPANTKLTPHQAYDANIGPAFDAIVAALSETRELLTDMRKERDDLLRLLAASEAALTYLRRHGREETSEPLSIVDAIQRPVHQRIGFWHI